MTYFNEPNQDFTSKNGRLLEARSLHWRSQFLFARQAEGLHNARLEETQAKNTDISEKNLQMLLGKVLWERDLIDSPLTNDGIQVCADQ
jgi:hypothetical protein